MRSFSVKLLLYFKHKLSLCCKVSESKAVQDMRQKLLAEISWLIIYPFVTRMRIKWKCSISVVSKSTGWMVKMPGEKCDQKSPFHHQMLTWWGGGVGVVVGGEVVELWWFVYFRFDHLKGPFCTWRQRHRFLTLSTCRQRWVALSPM